METSVTQPPCGAFTSWLRAGPAFGFALIGFVALGTAMVGAPGSPMGEPYSGVGELVYLALVLGAVAAAPMIAAVLLFIGAVILVAGSVRERVVAFVEAMSRLTPHFGAVAVGLIVLAVASIVYATAAPNIDWVRGDPGLAGWHAAAMLPFSPLAAWGAFVLMRRRVGRSP